MRIIARKKLSDFWKKHPDSEAPLRAWFVETRAAHWRNFAEVKQAFNHVDRAGERLVFNIGGNKYRLVVLVDFQRHGVLVRFVGTHKQYDRIDAASV